MEENLIVTGSVNVAEKFNGKWLVIVGGSHAGRLTDCIHDLKVEMVDLLVPGWTVMKKNLSKAAAELEKEAGRRYRS
jgi:hypothetical protein